MTRAIRIGVTGKIGSGKSTLLRMMTERGIEVVNTDQLAKELMQGDPSLQARIAELIGAAAYRDGKLDRGFVASQIFQDAEKRQMLEAIVHPAVMQAVDEVFRRSQPGKMVAVESAILLQLDLDTDFDYIILVDTPDDAVIARLAASGRVTEEDARKRLAEQHWETVHRSEADFVVENYGTEAEFEKRCAALLAMLNALALRPLPEEPLRSIEEEE